jgi:hypothetical protein
MQSCGLWHHGDAGHRLTRCLRCILEIKKVNEGWNRLVKYCDASVDVMGANACPPCYFQYII